MPTLVTTASQPAIYSVGWASSRTFDDAKAITAATWAECVGSSSARSVGLRACDACASATIALKLRSTLGQALLRPSCACESGRKPLPKLTTLHLPGCLAASYAF